MENGENLYSIISLEDPSKKVMSSEYIEKAWERDNVLIRAIQTGNKDLLAVARSIITKEEDQMYYYGNPVIAADMLRTRKNGMIIRNTMSRVAAGLGGVPPLYIHLIAEKYGRLIENANSIDYLINTVSMEMFDEYCDLVANFSAAHYSAIVKEVAVYITNHLQEEMSVSILAETFHINASHLSRKFKKETGYTISEYVNRQKIDASKLLFSRGHKSVMDVAASLGFNSSSYFSKTFKKITGESPADYIQKMARTHIED